MTSLLPEVAADMGDEAAERHRESDDRDGCQPYPNPKFDSAENHVLSCSVSAAEVPPTMCVCGPYTLLRTDHRKRERQGMGDRGRGVRGSSCLGQSERAGARSRNTRLAGVGVVAGTAAAQPNESSKNYEDREKPHCVSRSAPPRTEGQEKEQAARREQQTSEDSCVRRTHVGRSQLADNGGIGVGVDRQGDEAWNIPGPIDSEAGWRKDAGDIRGKVVTGERDRS